MPDAVAAATPVAASQAPPAAVQLSQLSVQFAAAPAPVVAGVSLTVATGAFQAIVGPSGCGKSTLLRVMAGLLAPSGGEAQIFGEPATVTRQTSFVFQEPRLLPWRTALENVCLPLELRGVGAQRIDQAQAALRLVNLLPGDDHKYPRQLSGGMRMRVSLARALVTQPQLLLLDEPFAALDDLLRQDLQRELLRIWQEQRFTAVFVTHNIDEAVFLAERVLVMAARPGRLVGQVESPRTSDRYASELVAASRDTRRLLEAASR